MMYRRKTDVLFSHIHSLGKAMFINLKLQNIFRHANMADQN